MSERKAETRKKTQRRVTEGSVSFLKISLPSRHSGFPQMAVLQPFAGVSVSAMVQQSELFSSCYRSKLFRQLSFQSVSLVLVHRALGACAVNFADSNREQLSSFSSVVSCNCFVKLLQLCYQGRFDRFVSCCFLVDYFYALLSGLDVRHLYSPPNRFSPLLC